MNNTKNDRGNFDVPVIRQIFNSLNSRTSSQKHIKELFLNFQEYFRHTEDSVSITLEYLKHFKEVKNFKTDEFDMLLPSSVDDWEVSYKKNLSILTRFLITHDLMTLNSPPTVFTKSSTDVKITMKVFLCFKFLNELKTFFFENNLPNEFEDINSFLTQTLQ